MGHPETKEAIWQPGNRKPLRQCASGAHPASIPQSNANCLCTKPEITLANGTFLRYDPYSGGGWLPVQEFMKGGRSASGPAMCRALGKDPVRDPRAGNGPRQKGPGAASRFGSLCQSRDPELTAQNIEEYDEYVAEAGLRETTLRGAQRCSVQTPRPASGETAAETEAAEDHSAEMALCREEMP